MRLLVYIQVLLFFVIFTAHGKEVQDLLQIPAQMSAMAPKSLLMDVVNTGTHLVAVGEGGYILYSDNGQEWIQAQVPASVTLTAVSFPTSEKGWAVGHDGVILNTVDGGRTWIKQMDGIKINELMLRLAREKVAVPDGSCLVSAKHE